MNCSRKCATLVLLFLLVVSFGCNKKEETPVAKAPATTGGDQTKVISGQGASGKIVVSDKDKNDAEAAASRVLSQMEAGEFSAIYNNAAPGFKQIGSEELFVAKFQQTRQKIGPLKNSRLISFVPLQDKTLVLVYRMENDRFTTDRRLTFDRSPKSGRMELFGLNQHDEPKK